MPALICAFSASEGNTTTRPPGMVKVLALEADSVCDITFYLSLIGLTQADDPVHITTNDVDNTVQTLPNKCIASYSCLTIVASGVFHFFIEVRTSPRAREAPSPQQIEQGPRHDFGRAAQVF